jgi:ABC-2 type transport system permease protein
VASVYWQLASARLRALTSSPRLFAMRCLGDAVLILVEALGPIFLVNRFGSIAGWSGPEVVMLIGIARAGEGFALMVGRGVEPTIFSETVRLGRFDQVLTRPVSPLGWLLTSELEVRHAFRGLAGIALAVWAAGRSDVSPTLANIGVLLAACIASTLFVLCVLILGAALTFRTVEGSDIANLAANGGIGLVSFPLDLYGSALRFVFTFLVPIGLFVYVPVLYVLHRDGPGVLGPDLLAVMPVAVVALVGVTTLAWQRGLHHYQSTGS